ncbi:MAG: hypothetical protein JSR57_00350 [Verrucomicrobia bacterium]|nr:hypothetical protein [Verrucomicrobiota bacterium]
MATAQNCFTPQLLDSATSLRAYLSGQEAIDQINRQAASPLSSASSKLNDRWEVFKWEVDSTFQDIIALFLKSVTCLLNSIGATDLAKRCHVASRHAMASTLYLTHFYEMGDRFLMASLNSHRTDTDDLYLQSSIEPGAHPTFEIHDIDDRNQGIHFFHRNGICRGMANWFLYLYFKTQAQFTNPDEHIKAVTKQFEAGAPREASLLHSLNEEATTQVLNLGRQLDLLHCDPIRQTDRQIAEEFCALPPGAYAVYSSSHRVNWINLGNGRGYFYNPSFGSDRIDGIEDLTKCVKEFVKTHHVTETTPHLLIDRIISNV